MPPTSGCQPRTLCPCPQQVSRRYSALSLSLSLFLWALMRETTSPGITSTRGGIIDRSTQQPPHVICPLSPLTAPWMMHLVPLWFHGNCQGGPDPLPCDMTTASISASLDPGRAASCLQSILHSPQATSVYWKVAPTTHLHCPEPQKTQTHLSPTPTPASYLYLDVSRQIRGSFSENLCPIPDAQNQIIQFA